MELEIKLYVLILRIHFSPSIKMFKSHLLNFIDEEK